MSLCETGHFTNPHLDPVVIRHYRGRTHGSMTQVSRNNPTLGLHEVSHFDYLQVTLNPWDAIIVMTRLSWFVLYMISCTLRLGPLRRHTPFYPFTTSDQKYLRDDILHGTTSRLARYCALSPNASIHVSPLQLGGMSIGDKWEQFNFESMNKESSFKLLDTFYDAGGNFIDTANV